jgi:hypothetical protein
MRKRFLSNPGTGLRFSFWPTALIGIVVIKAVLSLDVKPGSFLVSYSGISYFLLLLLATSFAIRNGIQNTLGRLGLIRIEQRVSLAEGTFSIDSEPEKGTTVHVSLPLRSGNDSKRAAG